MELQSTLLDKSNDCYGSHAYQDLINHAGLECDNSSQKISIKAQYGQYGGA